MFTRLAKSHSAARRSSQRASGVRAESPSFTMSGLLLLQRTAGNQAVRNLLAGRDSPAGAHPALNRPGDRYEREADCVADEVMSVQQAGPSEDHSGGERTTGPGGDHPSARSTGGQALPADTREFFERRFGHDFADVRVHADGSNDQSAQGVGARAYTAGEDITFASGHYQPWTRQGKHLLAHELAHVVQQSRARGHTHAGSVAASLSPAPAGTVQRKLLATGDTAGFAALANSIIAVQFEIRISNAGEVTIHSTNVQGPPTRDAQELLNTLRIAINDRKTTTIEFIRGASSARASDRNVIVGNYALARVDLDDVEQFGMTSSHSREGDNAAVQLVHEITEQYRKQVHGEGFQTAHQAGYRAQERVLGATLVNETPMTPIGGDLGEVTTTYRYPDGRIVDVTTQMNFRTGQIVSVRRVIR